MFDFPNSPANGALFTPIVGGPTYSWDSTAWRIVSGGQSGVFISDTPPSNPVQGMLWWESDTGNTFIYYNDGSSGQWVQFNLSNQPRAGGFIQCQVITVSGAITLDPQTTYFQVEVQGGGGAGAGSSTAGVNTVGSGPGGNAGAYCSKWIRKPSGVYSPSCTIGAAGQPAANGTYGGAGGNSQFTDGTNTITAGGGLQTGTPAPSGNLYFTQNNSMIGQAASGGDINCVGMPGSIGIEGGNTVTTTTLAGAGGTGGSTKFGGGGVGTTFAGAIAAGGSNGFTADARSYGAGGGGAVYAHGGSYLGGGPGIKGCVVITEFC